MTGSEDKDVVSGQSSRGFATDTDSSANGDATTSPAPQTETHGTDTDLSNDVKGLAISGDMIEPPVAKTAAGAPEGDVVFDHKPSESELEEVRHSLDASRASIDGKK